MARVAAYLLVLSPILLLLIGCNGAGRTPTGVTQPPVGSGLPHNAAPQGPPPQAAWDLVLDAESLEATLTPVRQGALGESYTVSALNFFADCPGCLEAAAVRREATEVVVTFRLGHPFSPTNRRDLDAFDVALVILPVGETATSYGLTGESGYSDVSDSADGYTRELANLIGDPAALPYFLVVDDAVAATDTFNRFEMGEEYSFDAGFRVAPGDATRLQVFIKAHYGKSSTPASRMTPLYFNPEFNSKAAWKVEVTPPPVALGTTWDDQPGGIPYEVEVKVWDWQIGADVDPALADPSSVAAASEVAEVSCEIPGMTAALPTLTTPTSGDGSPANPLLYEFNIANTNLLAAGEYRGLVRVLDTRTPATTAPNVDAYIHRDDDGTLEYGTIPEYATYQTFIATVLLAANDPPVVGDVSGCATAFVNVPATFTVSASDPNPGDTLTYRWDNGLNTPGVYDDGTTLVNTINFTYATPGTYLVDVEVDDGNGHLVTSPTPLPIEVLPAGTYVDADYVGAETGTITQPYNTIQEAITALPAGGNIYVAAATAHYTPPTLVSNLTVRGYDPSCGIDRPIIDITTPAVWATSRTNITLRNLVLSYNISGAGGTDLVRFNSVAGMTLRDCRFTGHSSRSGVIYLFLSNVDNLLMQGNEFVAILHDSPASAARSATVVSLQSGCDNPVVKQNEFHNIGFPNTGADVDWSTQLILGFSQSSNVTVTNNLFYDLFDDSPQSGAARNYITVLFCGNTASWTIANNTWDNMRPHGGNPTTYGVVNGIYQALSTAPLTFKNNLFRCPSYYTGAYTGNRNAAFWADSNTFSTPATYSNSYWGTPAPLGSLQVSSYLNLITKGIGSYDQNDLIDPNFTMTPGPNYYRPQNALVLIGGEGGTQMGAFGGPDGNWTPPSQL